MLDSGTDMDETGHDYSADVPQILSGKFPEYVVTHSGRSQYSQAGGGVSACGLAALNCARLVLGLHATGLGTTQLVQELVKRRCLEDILRPCLSWSNSAHLAVDEIHRAPVFHRSLELVGSDYGQPSFDFFQRLISNLAEYSQKHAMSSCVIVTRPPEIIACFCITDVPSQLFVVFDSHPRPQKHPHGAAFIFKDSIRSAARYLTDLLRYDERLLADRSIQWQAQLLAHVSGDTFIARNYGRTGIPWADATLDASLQVLSLQARVKEFELKNENYKADNKRLNEQVLQLEEKTSEIEDKYEKLKKKYEKLKAGRVITGRPSTPPSFSAGAPAPTHSPLVHTYPSHHVYVSPPRQITPQPHLQNGRSPTAPHASTRSLIDPLAAQLQRDYDEEHRQLTRQYQHLKDTQPTLFDCGVCFEHLEEDFIARVMPCRHTLCRSCLRSWSVSKIEEHRYPILCPMCTADKSRTQDLGEVDDLAVRDLGLTPEQYEIFEEMQLSRFSTLIHCRKCLKTIFVDKTEYQEAQEIVCPLPGCMYVWCKACSQEIQVGGPKHSCDGSSELQHLMSQHGWKHCPGCQTPAEKIDGCNHMTCMSPGCNTHFCYHCGALVVRSVIRREIDEALTAHYRGCTLF